MKSRLGPRACKGYFSTFCRLRIFVNFQKIPMYNAVNTLHGCKEIAIYSPLEVVEYEEQDV